MTVSDYKHFKAAKPSTSAWNEADSNADTCCLGKNFIVLEYTQRTADVYPYDTSYSPLTNVPIVTAATAWDDPSNNTTWLLIVNEGLFYGDKLDHSLLNPNQIRHFGNIFQDNPYDRENELAITCPDMLKIPLETKGTKIRFNSRVPTMEELNSIPETCQVHLTSPHPWNPATVQLSGTVSAYHLESCNNVLMTGDGHGRSTASAITRITLHLILNMKSK